MTLAGFSQTETQQSQALSVNLNPRILFPSAFPDRIILNLTATPENSIGVNWRTDANQTSGQVQFALATPGTQFTKVLDSVAAKVEKLTVSYQDEPDVTANYHSAILKNLIAGKSYVYRVGNGNYWSEWFQFTVPKSDGKISFLYFGDAQNDVKNHWSRLLRNAYRAQPHIDFMMHAGDLINRSNHDIEWGNWFESGAFIHATIPSIMTPGNHEYNKQNELAPQWRKQFTLPSNGPKGLEETSFEVDFGNLKVVTLDANMINDEKEIESASYKWLDSVLSKNTKKWTVVMIHFPLFSTKSNRDNPELRELFKPLFEKHKVDLVLQGHDHGYGRGIIQSGKEKHNTAYIVSNSGPKMYEVGDNKTWMQRRASNTQLFQLIDIEKDTLLYRAYTAAGDLYDSFKVTKTSKNKLEELIPNTPELR